jgi:D-amino peptidase
MARRLRNSFLIFSNIFCLGSLSLLLAQQPGKKALVLYDMEGVTGATNVKHTGFGQLEYDQARQSLTDDVNAAIAGLKSAGATEIIVVDGHGSGNSAGPDVLEEKLLPPAKMISRDRGFDIYMDSYDQSIDAVVAIAMHAGAGNEKGFLSHTYTIQDIHYKVNGVSFNESMIFAAGLARYRIPLIMVSGDDQLAKEVSRYLPWVKYATIKMAKSRSLAEPVPREEASRRIETAAREALQSLSTMRVFETSGPYRFALTFQNEAQGRAAAMLPGAEPGGDASIVQVRSNDFEDGYRKSLQLITMAGHVMRAQEYRRVINAQPNAKEIQKQLSEQIEAHWLSPSMQPEPAVPAFTRFWGAR